MQVLLLPMNACPSGQERHASLSHKEIHSHRICSSLQSLLSRVKCDLVVFPRVFMYQLLVT